MTNDNRRLPGWFPTGHLVPKHAAVFWHQMPSWEPTVTRGTVCQKGILNVKDRNMDFRVLSHSAKQVSKKMEYTDIQFNNKIEQALQRVRAVLDNTRNPTLPSNVSHQYDDKYTLAESVIKTSCAAQIQALEVLGLNAEKLAKLKAFAADRTVTLSLRSKETCKFVKKVQREEDSPTKHVKEVRAPNDFLCVSIG